MTNILWAEKNLPLFTIGTCMSNSSEYFENIWWQNESKNQSQFKVYKKQQHKYLRDIRAIFTIKEMTWLRI